MRSRPAPTASVPAHARRVLLIEDDATIAKLTQYVLTREGYEVIVATDGPEGLAAIRTHRPTAVLLDLTLPGLNGDDVCRAVRQDAEIADTFLIIVTARDEHEVRHRAHEAGADAYACKPCDPDRLVELVERAFAPADDKASSFSARLQS
jgi:DNA-binding response OmpR family regulator